MTDPRRGITPQQMAALLASFSYARRVQGKYVPYETPEGDATLMGCLFSLSDEDFADLQDAARALQRAIRGVANNRAMKNNRARNRKTTDDE